MRVGTGVLVRVLVKVVVRVAVSRVETVRVSVGIGVLVMVKVEILVTPVRVTVGDKTCCNVALLKGVTPFSPGIITLHSISTAKREPMMITENSGRF